MSLFFFVKSATVNIAKYTIKDIPGSSGRLDVISRCILSALLRNNTLEKGVQIWAFLDKYGTFIFNSDRFNNKNFPKNEILLTDLFVEIIKKANKQESFLESPLAAVKISQSNIFDVIKNFSKKNYKIYALSEKGIDFNKEFRKLNSEDNLLFIVGDQSGDLLNNIELKKLNLKNISLGNRSYLASSTIRLIKINLQLLI